MTESNTPQSAGTATGILKIDGKPLQLKYAYAMSQPNVFHEERNDVAILLTSTPLPADALQGKEDLSRVVPDAGWAFFKIDDKGEAINETIDHPSLGERRLMSAGVTHANFAAKEIGKDRVAGSFETEKADNSFDHQYEIKVSFDAPIVQAKRPDPLPDAKTGETLATGGGEPGKAYLTLQAAILKKDFATVRGFIPDIEDEEMFDLYAEMTPKNQKIGKGYVKNDLAVLYVSGTMGNEQAWGTMAMIRKDGRWLLRESGSFWSNEPHKE